jgi:DNA-binding NarL/FixJ family response regulator
MEFLVRSMKETRLQPTDPIRHRLRLLLVDDMPQVLQDLHQLLEITGLIEIVGEARNGAEAIRMANDLAPDAILMDLEMPGMNGFEATQQIKERRSEIRVVILSVHTGAKERARARAAGADCFVMKGADYEVLVDAIQGEIGWPDYNGNGKR